MRKFSEAGLIDEPGSNWTESIDYLKAVVEMVKVACAKFAIAEERVITTQNRTNKWR